MRVAAGAIFDPATGVDLKAPTTETYADRISGGVTDVPRLVGKVFSGAAKGAMSNLTFGIWADEPAFQPRTKLEAAGKAWGGTSATMIGALSMVRGSARPGSKGGTATRQQLDDLANRVNLKHGRGSHVAGASKKEFYLPGPAGTKGSNRTDLTYVIRNPDGTIKSTVHVNTADTYASGRYTSRELAAAHSIRTKFKANPRYKGHRLVLIPKVK